jgi:hypothetical protein
MAGQSVSRTGKDRRQINTGSGPNRRGSKPDRRRCPSCGGKLSTALRRIAGGTVSTVRCGDCDWSRSSRQTDLKTLMAKLTWSMPLERKTGGYSLPFPHELAQSLGLKAGDEFVLKPLTSPLGKLSMKWALEVKRGKK